MCRLAVLLLVSLSLLWACRGDAGQGRRAHGGREQKMTFGGFLEHKGWLSSKEDLVRFGLVTDPGDLAEPPSRWRIKTGGWLDDETYLNRLRASVLEETYAEGKLKIDPTRYLALCFRDRPCYIVEVADVKPGRGGMLLFADGYVKLTEDFRRLIEQAYGFESFTTDE